MARFDKYDPISGGFRAPLNAAVLAADKDKVQAVSLNASGNVIPGGASALRIKGVICPGRAMAAGDIVDVMTDGEIVDFALAGATAGEDLYGDIATGALTETTTSNQYVGHLVEASRLIVRVKRG